MTVPLIRYVHRSTKDCLLSAASVVMSARLPTHQLPDGSWTGDLPPDLVVKNYERQYGPVPSYGADPGNVWALCESAYNLHAFSPAHPFGWDLTMLEKLISLGCPVMIPFYVSWDWSGNPLTAHAVTAYGFQDGRIALWDQNAGRDLVWTEDDLFTQWVWRDGWLAFPKWTGWQIVLVPPDWGNPESW